jgi:hypothetical protein
MKIFDFDPTELRDTYRSEGWLHIPGGATPEFVDYVRSFVSDYGPGGALSGKGLAGAKDQLLLEFPAGTDYTAEVFDSIAALCDLERSTMTLSERHVKIYDADAVPNSRPHKDRYASQIAVGISIDVAPESCILLYPHDALDVNPMLRPGLVDTLPPEQQPEVVLRDTQPVEVFDSPGDVQVFPGAAVWHGRRNSAGTVIVYFKVNDFGCDPLAEDPQTPIIRQHTLAALGDPDDFRPSVPRLSRRFESVTREYTRAGWGESLLLNVWEQPARRISEHDVVLLRAVDGIASVEDLIAGVGGDSDATAAAFHRLAELGAIDLVSPTDR